MTKERILLVGRGHLGSFLRERLGVPEALHWTGEMDELGAERIKDLAPAAVLNTAGKTDLPWCEENPREAFRCNVSAPLALWRRVQSTLGPETPYIHLSSGCVWDGPYREDGAPFGPSDPPRPACFYAWTKAACDALLRQEAGRGALLILRPRQVYSPLDSPRNTLTKLRIYPKLIATPNSMTSAETIATAITRALERLARGDEAGASFRGGRILNVYDRGVTSPFEVGIFLAEAGLREPPAKISKDELDRTLVPKRVDAVLADPFFEDLVDPPRVQDELRRVISLYAEKSSAE